MKKIFNTIFLLAIFSVLANASEPEANDKSSNDSSAVISIEHKSRFLSLVSLPFVHVVQPAVEFLMYPVIPPLIYVSRENLIERGHNLITYGDKGQIMFYPLINAKVGNSSNIGFAYRHANLLFDNDYMFLVPHLYTNADWDASIYYKKSKMFGTSFFSEFGASYREIGNSDFRDPNTITYTFADSSANFSAALGFNIIGSWNLKFAVGSNFYRFAFPNIKDTIAADVPEAMDRGFYQHFNTFPLALSLFRNTLDEPYAPTKGHKFSVGYAYAPVTSYNGSSDHNYHAVESRFVHYFLLGNKSYAMTVAESEANRERLKNLSFKEAIEILNPISIREKVERRVLVTQIKARYMIEENKDKAPFTAMGRLGGNYPLRAYPNSYFTAPLIAGISTEYRWPIDIYADALIFNEYGIFGNDFKNLPLSNLRNSYGFGFRVRTPKLFITRFALAFHGMQGVSIILTTKPDYE